MQAPDAGFAHPRETSGRPGRAGDGRGRLISRDEASSEPVLLSLSRCPWGLWRFSARLRTAWLGLGCRLGNRSLGSEHPALQLRRLLHALSVELEQLRLVALQHCTPPSRMLFVQEVQFRLPLLSRRLRSAASGLRCRRRLRAGGLPLGSLCAWLGWRHG